MKSRPILLPAILVTCALLATSAADGRPWGSPAGPGQGAALASPPSQEPTVENGILVGIIVIGFGALTIRMLRYRREMEKSVLRRLRQEWAEGRAMLESGRSFLKEHIESGAFPDRRATPRTGEREVRAEA